MHLLLVMLKLFALGLHLLLLRISFKCSFSHLSHVCSYSVSSTSPINSFCSFKPCTNQVTILRPFPITIEFSSLCLFKNYPIAWALYISSTPSHQSIPMLCLSGVSEMVRLHAPCPIASLLHSDSLKILHAVAAQSGTCPFPMALSLSTRLATPSTIRIGSGLSNVECESHS